MPEAPMLPQQSLAKQQAIEGAMPMGAVESFPVHHLLVWSSTFRLSENTGSLLSQPFPSRQLRDTTQNDREVPSGGTPPPLPAAERAGPRGAHTFPLAKQALSHAYTRARRLRRGCISGRIFPHTTVLCNRAIASLLIVCALELISSPQAAGSHPAGSTQKFRIEKH